VPAGVGGRRILIIRLGALGDFVLSFPAFASLRAHHAGDHLTLLTTAPFAGLAADSPWFDEIRVDTRPPWLDLPGVLRLRRQLRGFDFVYDLQTSGRSSRYYLLAGRPCWSGIARGCSHPDPDPRRDFRHTIDRQRGQLAAAGVPAVPRVDLSWLSRQGPVLHEPYALLVPGTSAAHGGAKRWPVERYGSLAGLFSARGWRPVVVGTAAERADAAHILSACPAALDLTGQTTIQMLAGLAHRAQVAVGGDTGPIHLAAAMGCRVVALFSRFSDPALAGPIGDVAVLRADALDQVAARDVAAAAARLAGQPARGAHAWKDTQAAQT
jgi:ADP-heptose:LPS heptosyltransferase